MVYYEDDEFDQATSLKDASSSEIMLENEIRRCKIINGDAFFWALFALICVALICLCAFFVQRKAAKGAQAGVPLEVSQQYVVPVLGFDTDSTEGKFALAGIAAVAAAVSMFIAQLTCRPYLKDNLERSLKK